MINETIKLTGRVIITLYDDQGVIKSVLDIPNLVVDVGKIYIANRIITPSPTYSVMTHMAIGISSAAPQVTDTTLGLEVYRSSLSSFTANNNVINATAAFNANQGSGSITEAGIFNSSSGGIMLCHTQFPSVPKLITDAISINWSITVS